MRVLFVHEGYTSEGKDEYYSVAYDNEAVERYKILADEVMFLTRKKAFKASDKNQNKIDVEGFSFIGVENFKSLKGILHYPDVRNTVKNSVKEADYIVARLPSDLGNLAIKYALKYNKIYVIELVGCAWDALWNYNLIGKTLAPFLYYKTKLVVKNSPYVVYVSSKFLQDRYPTNGLSTNISNVILHNVKMDPKMNSLSEKQPIILGTIGALNVKYKGQRHVINAIYDLKKLGYKLEYQLVGGGDSSYLKSLVDKHNLYEEVKFIGPLPHNEIFNWLDNIDIYVQPSNTEGLPRSLIEAMSKSCICIGSDAGGIPELLPKSNIFKKRNVEDLKRVIINAINNGENTIQYTYDETLKYSYESIEAQRKRFFEAFQENKSNY